VIEFRLLGPLELRCGGVTQTVRSHSQAMLLISLLVSEGRQVPAEALIDELWGGGHPADPANALQAHISRLRRLLDGLEPERKASRLTSQSAGYQLRMNDDELDGCAFLAEVAALPGAAVELPPHEVANRARQALGRWRGPVFGGVVGGAICQSGAARYQLGRYRALEALFEGELGCGNHAAIVPELSALVAAPSLFQERFCEQLMVALYRSGRQADALDLYHRTWNQLAEGTRVQPSGRLKAYVRAILEHDPILAHSGQRRHPYPAGPGRGTTVRRPAVAVR
jgi:SARP family transcriptional regulator, regulator of embCAB operon